MTSEVDNYETTSTGDSAEVRESKNAILKVLSGKSATEAKMILDSCKVQIDDLAIVTVSQ